ncbi:MAG: SsrA-binding protein SmpB [Pseudomonadota bacterium]|nr:MAG: SsrA-binding protein SmpB [Desulfobacteraceae bacterium]
MDSKHIKVVAENRKARHDFFIDDEYEAGMVLKGTEVKSLRGGSVNIKDAYAKIRDGEIFLYQMHIGEYPFAHYDNHETLRIRKLLLHQREIRKLYAKANEKGYALIPLRVYFKNGKAKVSIGLARGKKAFDKRESIKQREAKRDLDRMKKNY